MVQVLSGNEFRGYFSQASRIDASASLNIAPGKIPRREPHVLGKALVPVATRVGRRDQLLNDRAARRFEGCWRAARMLAQRFGERNCVFHRQPRTGADREMRRAPVVAYQYHVSRGPAGVS